MNLFATLFQGQNLIIMIGLGIFVVGAIILISQRTVRRMTPEDKVYYQRLARQQAKFRLERLVGFGVLIVLMYAYLAWLRR